jgi:hypothetical protein
MSGSAGTEAAMIEAIPRPAGTKTMLTIAHHLMAPRKASRPPKGGCKGYTRWSAIGSLQRQIRIGTLGLRRIGPS